MPRLGFLCWIFGAEAVVLGVMAWHRHGRVPLPTGAGAWLLCCLVVAFGVVANYYTVGSIKDAPNHGYTLAIQEARLIAVTLLSVPLFNSEFSLRKLAS